MTQQQTHPTSPMSLAQICNSSDSDSPKNLVPPLTIDRDDPSVQLAAEALGDMARTQEGASKIVLPPLPALSSGPPSPTFGSNSNSRYVSFSSDSSIATADDEHLHHHHHHPPPSNYDLVDSAWRAYHGSTNMVKYGAEMVGSFYERYGRRSSIATTERDAATKMDEDEDEDVTVATARILARTTLSDNGAAERDVLRKRRHEDACARRRSKSPYAIQPHHLHTPRRSARQPASTWQQLVVHASSAAGTTAAVISEESMKCLRYCLSWIQYAIHHIEQQMALLRSYLVSLAQAPADAQPQVVTRVKKEMVDTIRKVVEVVSKYAGSSLPQQAKETVRGFILGLPAKANASLKNTGNAQDRGDQEGPIKLLNFGGESIEMLQAVSTVFSDTVDRADLWLDRLRVMGVVPQQNEQGHKDMPQ